MNTILGIFKTYLNVKIMSLATLQGLMYTLFLEYVFNDFQFALSLGIIVFIDFCLGLYFSVREKDFDPDVFWRSFEKAFIYSAILVTGHICASYKIDGVNPGTLSFVKNTLYSGMVIRELLSILQFAGKRYPKLVNDVLKYFRTYKDDTIPTDKKQ